MSILFGHPTGNPNSHQAALAHFERDRLEAFCVPWFPSETALAFLRSFPSTRAMATRLERRRFEPLVAAPKIQGHLSEFNRLLRRALSKGDEGLSYDANDWLMRTMVRECHRPSVTAVHSYEDCSLLQFEEAKRRGKACIYDMPIGYYPAWQQTEKELAKEYSEWLPRGGLPSHRFARPGQKKREMELADVVLVPSSFVEKTISRFLDKKCARAFYGVDSAFWRPGQSERGEGGLRFICAGQLSIRKGTPILLEAWNNAGIGDANLLLVGPWLLSDDCQRYLSENVKHVGQCSQSEMLRYYQSSDIFVFPSFFEGFGLVLLEAMACGLPVVASDATAAPDFVDEETGQVFAAGDVDGLIDALRLMAHRSDKIPQMKKAAREKACDYSWSQYRHCVSVACEKFAQ
jgi:alpha-maltose-1-phosphate synthase